MAERICASCKDPDKEVLVLGSVVICVDCIKKEYTLDEALEMASCACMRDYLQEIYG